MKTEEKFLQLSGEVKLSFEASDYLKVVAAPHLAKLQDLFNNLATGSVLERTYSSFNDYLIQELGRNKARVMNVLRIGKYVNEYNIDVEELYGIPLPHIELVAKHEIKYDEDTLRMIRDMDYKTLKLWCEDKKKKT